VFEYERKEEVAKEIGRLCADVRRSFTLVEMRWRVRNVFMLC